jgi:hypothetical protein
MLNLFLCLQREFGEWLYMADTLSSGCLTWNLISVYGMFVKCMMWSEVTWFIRSDFIFKFSEV